MCIESDPALWTHGDYVDRDAPLNLIIQQSLHDQIKYFLGVFDVYDGPQVDVPRIVRGI